VIFVDDKSSDTTAQLIKEVIDNKNFRAIFHEKNIGRGGAVSDGIRVARGRIVGYLDIDLEIALEYIPKMLFAVNNGWDVVCAKRSSKFAILNVFRDLLHNLYKLFANIVLSLPVSDPNAGCKFFNREKILPVLDKTIDKHWFWDTEIIKRAKLEGLSIKEVPVVYVRNFRKKSSVSVFSDTIHFIKQLFWLRQQLSKGIKK